MTKSFTQNDLVRYLYQEMPPSESEEFTQALQICPSLMQEYMDMLESVDRLNQLFQEPSNRVTERIKGFAGSPRGLEKV